MTSRKRRSDGNSILTYVIALDGYQQEGLVCVRPYFFTHVIGKEKGSPKEPKGRDKSFQENENGKGKIFKGTKKAIYVPIDEL